MATEEPLLRGGLALRRPTSLALFWACINLYATTVGAGVLSVPICFSYCRSSTLALLLLTGFGVISAASLHFISGAAGRTGASSYLALGERCYGNAGTAAVLWSLLGLLGGAIVQMTIIIVDLTQMLIAKLLGQAPSRALLFASVTIAAVPLCLPRELDQLRFTSSVSVVAILFTCGCIISLSLFGDGEDDGGGGLDGGNTSAMGDGWVLANSDSSGNGWILAMPIFSLAYCSQFQIIEIEAALPKTNRKRLLPHLVHLTMGGACTTYALVGIACYTMLGDRLSYPTPHTPSHLTSHTPSHLPPPPKLSSSASPRDQGTFLPKRAHRFW